MGIVGTKPAFNPHSGRVRRKRQRLPSSLLIENGPGTDRPTFAWMLPRRAVSDQG